MIMYFKKLLIFFLFTSTVVLASKPVEGIKISETYRFHPGDDSTWAQPELNDSNWKQYNIDEFPKDEWTGVGWARFTLEVDTNYFYSPLGIRCKFVGALEVYIDGILTAHYGKIGSSVETETPWFVYEYPEIQPVSIPKKFTDGKKYAPYILAVRFSNFVITEGELKGLESELDLQITSYEKLRNEANSIVHTAVGYQQFFLGVLISFSVIFLLLYLYYRDFKPNLFFAVLTLIVAIAAYLRFERVFIDDVDSLLFNQRMFNLATIIALLIFARLIYFLIYKTLPKIFIAFTIFIAVVFVGVFWIRPVTARIYLTILFFLVVLEISRVIVNGLIKKEEVFFEGSIIILIGAIPFLAALLFKFLARLEVLQQPWQFINFPYTYFSILILLFAVAMFLAKNYSHTNRNLLLQLRNVKKLSEENLKQQIEKTKLEAENERKTLELEAARNLQLSMLPQKLPERNDIDIAVFMKTATEVGGDYYDFVQLKDDNLILAIGDATGHGMQAGTMVAASKSLFKSLSKEFEPAEILGKSTTALKEMGFNRMFMALSVAKIESSTVTISSAGMPYPLFYRKATNRIEELKLEGMPLGSFADFKYEQKTFEINSGDVLLFMSDGFPELYNDQNEMLGYERTSGIFLNCRKDNAQDIIAQLKQAVNNWSNNYLPEDDITFLVLLKK